MPITSITVRGARQHNLKNIDVEIPRNTLTVITGLSGSGKSSLAFDTIYAEGQRRYVETLSAYARQFLDQMERPDVDGIDGLSPSISIEQKRTSRSPRSTVGTITETAPTAARKSPASPPTRSCTGFWLSSPKTAS
jgi:excinuclease ABC subunit A